MRKGRIIKSLAGFYDVESDGVIYTTKARGKFRKERFKPVTGDQCEFEVTDGHNGYILAVDERRNYLERPPISNVDQAILVFSITHPDFDDLLLDRFLANIESKNIKPLIVITKIDLDDRLISKIKQDYKNYHVIFVSSKTGEGVEEVKKELADKVTVFTGQSGVGKSSLLNALDIHLHIATNEISDALGRGKHTTRHVELIRMYDGYVADTPGFSSLELKLTPRELAISYHDFRELARTCRFRGCLHDSEPGCAVKEAVSQGDISSSRYQHYLMFLKEAKEREEKKYD